MLKYGNDKPDLRVPLNPMLLRFSATQGFILPGMWKRVLLCGPCLAQMRQPRHCDRMNSWAQSEGAPGMGYIIYGDGEARGPVAKALGAEKAEEIRIAAGVGDGDAVFFACARPMRPQALLDAPD